MNNSSNEQARHQAALDYAQQARPFFNLIFNTENKTANLIASFVCLEKAIHCLTPETIQSTLDANPEIKNAVADIQKGFLDVVQKLIAIEDWEDSTEPLAAYLPRSGDVESIDGNVIHVDFKRANG